jgi:hypothetical protein
MVIDPPATMLPSGSSTRELTMLFVPLPNGCHV